MTHIESLHRDSVMLVSLSLFESPHTDVAPSYKADVDKRYVEVTSDGREQPR